LCYARQTLRRQERRYLGHNPLGAWMIVALIVTLLVISVSGWLYMTDRFWGVAWVEMIHGKATDVLLVLVALHVSGVLYASWRHREISWPPCCTAESEGWNHPLPQSRRSPKDLQMSCGCD
jgi:cytochrome b